MSISSLPKTPVRLMVRQSLSMAWPIAGNRLIVAINNFIAMWLLALQGHDALAAGGLIFPTLVTVTVIIGSILFAISSVVSRAYGANDLGKIGAVIQQGWLLSLIMMLPTMLVLWFIKPILLSLGQAPALAQIAAEFFHAYLWGVIPMFFSITNQQLAIGVGKQRLSMFSTLMGSIVCSVVGYGLALGKLGLPHLGASGVGYAMSLQIWISFLWLSYYLCRNEFFAQFQLFNWRIRQSFGYLKQLFAIGWPMCVQIGGEIFAWFVITLLIGWLGETSLAAQQITGQFAMLVIIPVFGFAQASGVLIGHAAGAKRYQDIRRLGMTNIGIGVMFILIVAIFFIGLPKLLIACYLDLANPNNANTIHLAILIFAITAVNLFFDTIRNIVTGALRGLYDNRYPMYLSLIMMWLFGLPLAYALGFYWHFGVVGINFGNTVGITLSACILVWRWYKRYHVLMERAEQTDIKAAKSQN